MGFFIFQKYDTDVTFEKVMGQCHLSLTVAANDGEVLYRRKTKDLIIRKQKLCHGANNSFKVNVVFYNALKK